MSFKCCECEKQYFDQPFEGLRKNEGEMNGFGPICSKCMGCDPNLSHFFGYVDKPILIYEANEEIG